MRTMLLFFVFLFSSAQSKEANEFRLFSSDIAEGNFIKPKHLLDGFGCSGENVSPALQWSNPPRETKSFVITMYDPDAKSGSGWWHWTVYNISSDTQAIPQNASSNKELPEGSIQGMTDFGKHGYMGSCPPSGKMHRYQFTIFALSVEKLDLPPFATPAMIGYLTRENAIASDTITAIVKR